MRAIEIQNNAIISALNYYSEVNRTKRGRICVYALDIKVESPFLLTVTLSQKIKNPDSMRISVTNPSIDEEYYDDLNNRYLNPEYIEIYSYDENKKTVSLVATNTELITLLSKIPAHELCLVSDLTFLIKNVGKWYRNFGHLLKYPQSPQIDKSYIHFRNIESDEQKRAVTTALTRNVSYVWGAPGTGKTQIVLADCVMTYISLKKPVFILAPTNNAIEQSLRAVINALNAEDIPIDTLKRLGIPSTKFAEEFGSICETVSNTKKSERLQEKVDILKHTLSKITDTSHYDYFKMYYAKHVELSSAINNNTYEIDSLTQEHKDIVKKFKETEKRLKEEKSINKNLADDIDTLELNIRTTDLQIKKLKKKQNSFIYKIICFIKKININSKIEDLSQYLSLLNVKHLHKSDKYNISISELEQLNIQYTDLLEKNTFMVNHKEQLLKYNQTLSAELQEIDSILSSTIGSSADMKKVDFEKKEQELYQMHLEYLNKTKELNERLKSTEAELADLQATVSKSRQNNLVFAMTVDYFYSHYEELSITEETRLGASHIFMDEAAYLPMIKAGILFSLGIPVTLLGDHAQLPPICEVEELLKNMENNMFMWAQSALYFPELLDKNSTMHHAYDKWVNNKEPSKEMLKTTVLPSTYRFGNNLAMILDEFVYHNGFTGRSEYNTNITVINSKHKIGEDKRTNPNEVNAIKQYIETNLIPEYAVLTPYTNQLNLLKNAIRDNDDNILTIHASQGREWETVIISVTDAGSNWFTDSNNEKSKGKNVINTAISRAKKNIIIVCDADYWIKYSETQLIGRLVKKANRII